ncbi:MAG: adenylate kinase [Candidatus Parcubacteria bacterium]|nr:adenylate kinase [Candidatus Parcubacteria bacterium]
MISISLHGPPFSGKSTAATLLSNEFSPRVITVSIGKLCRGAQLVAGFRSQYGHFLQSGKELPDELIARLVNKRLQSDLPSDAIVVFDSFRTRGQLHGVVTKGFVEPRRAAAVVLECEESACQDRANYQRSMKQDGSRDTDDQRTITNGCNYFKENLPGIKEEASLAGMLLVTIRHASRDIEKEVFPEILAAIAPITRYLLPSRRESTATEQPGQRRPERGHRAPR